MRVRLLLLCDRDMSSSCTFDYNMNVIAHLRKIRGEGFFSILDSLNPLVSGEIQKTRRLRLHITVKTKKHLRCTAEMKPSETWNRSVLVAT